MPYPKPHIVVMGLRKWEERHFGRSLEILGVEATFIECDQPERIVEDYAPDLVVVSQEWTEWIRIAAAQARRAGIPVLYIMDGVIEWSYIWNNQSYIFPRGTALQPLLASHLAVIGRHPARILAGMGLASHVRIVGLPRLDGIAIPEVRSGVDPKKILVGTAKTFSHNAEQYVEVMRALRDLKEFFAGREDIEPIWRIADEAASELGVKPMNEGPFINALAGVTGVIGFCSTLLLESMLAKVPACLVEYRSVPTYVDTAWQIRSADHIEPTIHELIHPPAPKLALQDFYLEDELELGSASERLASVIREAIDSKGQPEAEVDDGRGSLDYRLVHSQISSFSLGSGPKLQYELEAIYSTLKQKRDVLQQTEDALRQTVDALDQARQHNAELIAHRDALITEVAVVRQSAPIADDVRRVLQSLIDLRLEVSQSTATIRGEAESVREHADSLSRLVEQTRAAAADTRDEVLRATDGVKTARNDIVAAAAEVKSLSLNVRQDIATTRENIALSAARTFEYLDRLDRQTFLGFLKRTLRKMGLRRVE